jgi:hypothetical protein
MDELASLAGRIGEAERALEQEDGQAPAIVEASNKRYLDHCRRLIATVHVVLEERKGGLPNLGWRVVVCSLLAKVISTVRAAYTLAKTGHAREVPVVVRSALESLVTATFIAQKDSGLRAKRWAQHSIIIKARLLKTRPDLSATPEQKKAAGRIVSHAKRLSRAFPDQRFWASGLKKGSFRHLAEDVGMLWYYEMVYWFGSQVTHGSAIAVDNYLGVAKDGTPLFKVGLSAEGLRGELAVCCDLLIRGLAVLNKISKLGIDQLLSDMKAEYASVFGEDAIAS